LVHPLFLISTTFINARCPPSSISFADLQYYGRAQLRAEKAELENVLEAESESLVLRLQRQLSLLMQQQQQSSQSGPTPAAPNSSTAPNSPSATIAPNLNALINNPHPLNPSPATLIEVLKTENSNLRNRLVDTEREFIKTSRQNEVYSFLTIFFFSILIGDQVLIVAFSLRCTAVSLLRSDNVQECRLMTCKIYPSLLLL
jgi:hypothetical protein